MKAGLSSLVDLRDAPLDRLEAVPGMSRIKACQVQTYLAQFSADTLAIADLRRAASQPDMPRPEHGSTAALFVDERIARARQTAASADSGLAGDLMRVMEASVSLLLSDPDVGIRGRLFRELARILNRCYAALDTPVTSDRACERAARGLRSALVALVAARSQANLDRKSQLRLADILSETCDRLETLVGRTPDPSAAEEKDE